VAPRIEKSRDFSAHVVLFNANLIVKSIICDQEPRNQGLIKKFNISESKTYFERFGHKIFLIFDPSHLIKSL